MNENEMMTCSCCGTEFPADKLTLTGDGDYVCDDCLAENFAECDCCGEYFPKDNLTLTANGDEVCESCRDNEYTYCERCSEWHPSDNVAEVHTGWRSSEYWCFDCIDRHAFQCEWCEDYFSEDEYDAYYSPRGELLCESCFNDRCTTCAECGEVLWRDDACWDDDADAYVCEDCHDRNRSRNVIHDYGYKPRAEFRTRKGVFDTPPADLKELFFGIEDECDKGDDARETASQVQEITDALYIKHDGSLDCGFEIVTHPCTLEYHTYEMPWKHICKTALNGGFKSHDARTCGLHVHVGVTQMADDRDEQRNIVGKIVLLVDRHWYALVKFSRRKESQLDHWAARPHIPAGEFTDDTYIRLALDTVHGGRYQAINLTNFSRNNTIEFRLFNGTLKRDTIIATLQLLDNLCHYAMTHTTEEVLASSFADIISVKDYKELTEYITERELTSVDTPAARTIRVLTAEEIEASRPANVGDRVRVVNDNGGGIDPGAVGCSGTVIGVLERGTYDYVVSLENTWLNHRCIGYDVPAYYVHAQNITRII